MKKIVLATLLSTPLFAQAAGFAITENGASGLGNAYAGAAAIAEDASTIWFNPAGMTYIEGTQVVGAMHFINVEGSFNDDGSKAAGVGLGPLNARPLGGEGGNLGAFAVIPNFFYKRDLTDTVKFGLGVTAPFGLKTEYDKSWLGRFQAIKSEVKSININPSLAFKVNEKLSLGFGLSAMWMEAELTSAVNLGNSESNIKVKGDDWGFGYNFGAIYQATEATRLGLSYRSKVKQDLDGKSRSPFTGLDALPNRTLNGDVIATTTLPESLSFSVFSKLNNRWDLMGDITWTKWSRFKKLAIDRDNGSNLTTTPENWNNVLRYSIGTNYQYNDNLKLRAGLAFDEEAIDTQYRTPRIPGNDRTWLTLGAGWQYSQNTKLDIGYAHIFAKDAKIDDNLTSTTPGTPGKGRVTGKYRGHADILSVQLTHNF